MRFGVRELIFLVVLLVVPVASYVYVFKPRNVEIREAQLEVELKRTKLTQLSELSKRLDDINLAIQKGREAIELIERKLPSQQDVEVILEDVWQLAKKFRLEVKSVKSENPLPAALYMEQPLKVVVEGNFEGFYQFLLALERLPRITRIHQLKLERGDSPGGRRNKSKKKELAASEMKAAFTLSIYFQPPKGASKH